MEHQIENLSLDEEQKKIAAEILELFKGRSAQFTEETINAVKFVIPSLALL